MNTLGIQEHKPISKKERIFELDIIRGFALIGVLLVNMFAFNTTFFNETFATTILKNPLMANGTLNKAIAIAVQLFAEGKFYTIFSCLFALGFYIFMDRAEKKDLSSKKLFLRRTLFLYIFGLVHYTLVWWGDILHVYGLIGFLLIFFKNCQLKTIKRWIIGLLMVSTLLTVGFTLLGEMAPLAMEAEAMEAQGHYFNSMVEESITLHQNGALLETIQYRLTRETGYRVMGLIVQIPKILGMFLIGLYIGKKKIFNDLERHRGFIRRTWKITGFLGALTTFMSTMMLFSLLPIAPIFSSSVTMFFRETGTICLSLFYMTSIVRLMKSAVFAKVLMPLRYVGQMALTNYLTQCILGSLIFYGHGLGLVQKVGPVTCVLLTVVIFGLQIPFSKYWLGKNQYGPCEWGWRRLTYGKAV